jgi:hypothetical protein
VNAKLFPWGNTLEFKLFDNLYLHHRTTQNQVRQLRQHAQKLLEQADSLQGHDNAQRAELERHIRNLPQNAFRRKLHRPIKVYPRPPVPPVRQTIPTRTAPSPSPTTPNLVHPRPPPYAQVPRVLRCFQCNSVGHMRSHCPRYRCLYCNKLAPGHPQYACPRNQAPFDDGIRGYVDVEGDDNNLSGEC